MINKILKDEKFTYITGEYSCAAEYTAIALKEFPIDLVEEIGDILYIIIDSNDIFICGDALLPLIILKELGYIKIYFPPAKVIQCAYSLKEIDFDADSDYKADNLSECAAYAKEYNFTEQVKGQLK
jgi:hypothetical protein